MENPTLDYEFDLTRSLSAHSYGDEGEGYSGEQQRSQLERKYLIVRRPAEEVVHPENRAEFVAAVQLYRPGMGEDESLAHLLDTTEYPFASVDWIRAALRSAWFESLDMVPFLEAAARHFPGRSVAALSDVLMRSTLMPDTVDVDGVLAAMAEKEAAIAERRAANEARLDEIDRQRERQWEAEREDRETRRAAYRIRAAYDRKARAEDDLARATARIAELEASQG
ncbi:hypothetical protein [Arthrobacter sp. IK3]|uniref:hypothetical protein n=1 Tax=Arthrobacter sp. IK3 TaxID=3448169 RepID=UPI003EE23A98